MHRVLTGNLSGGLRMSRVLTGTENTYNKNGFRMRVFIGAHLAIRVLRDEIGLRIVTFKIFVFSLVEPLLTDDEKHVFWSRPFSTEADCGCVEF